MLISDKHIFLGLLQDVSISKLSSEYLIDARNIRITARGKDTLLSITNEKGTKLLKDSTDSNLSISFEGTILGYCVLNLYLVVFTKSTNGDNIYRLDLTNPTNPNSKIKLVNDASLEFDYSNPIQAIGEYESESVLKVYWVDGINLPRVINIAKKDHNIKALNFVPELTFGESITINRKNNSLGLFPAGVIQYAFTYFNKYLLESNIFYISPLYYTSHEDRGAAPDEIVSNTFSISLSALDSNYDGINIYSIIRTSLNGTPICKKVTLLYKPNSNESWSATYLDTGYEGETIEPSSLFYKGGDEIIANTLCVKDNTLFLGNLKYKRKNVYEVSGVKDFSYASDKSSRTVSTTSITLNLNKKLNYYYNISPKYCAGFKVREWYRLGFLVQYKNGKWSDPIHIRDFLVPNNAASILKLPNDSGSLLYIGLLYLIPSDICSNLSSAGYKKVRPLIAIPTEDKRTIKCLGVINPTLYTERANSSIYPSWFFRIKTAANKEGNSLQYSEKKDKSPATLLNVEILGTYDEEDKFKISWTTVTFHSPDIEFKESLLNYNISDNNYYLVGSVTLNKTYSDLNITTSTAGASQGVTSFDNKESDYGVISGFYFKDGILDDSNNHVVPYTQGGLDFTFDYLVYPWQRSGSLNNDIPRPDNSTRTSMLNRKILSNLRIFSSTYKVSTTTITSKLNEISRDDSPIKISIGDINKIYESNVDTLLPLNTDAGIDLEGYYMKKGSIFFKTDYTDNDNKGVYAWSNNDWVISIDSIGDQYISLCLNGESVRMKFKTTAHIVSRLTYDIYLYTTTNQLPLVELGYSTSSPYSSDIKLDKWIPAGEPTTLSNVGTTIIFSRGDTWFLRYDCLKTYAFDKEDSNLVIEIGSFLLETRVNLDGRYDRNRGLASNLYMSPENFNLFNPVYSLLDNFFTYLILDEDYYKVDTFPNQITWSLEKQANQETDPWTIVTLSSLYNMDGTNGEIIDLETWNNNIYCFLNKSISNVLFNSRVLIPTSDGVPIEITNNYKVEGKRYLSDGLGCINKYAICPTPNGLYFIDSISNHLYSISSNGVLDISTLKNMTTWIESINNTLWKPNGYTTKLYYDIIHKDLYIVTNELSLCYNENLLLFTSFMDYRNIPVMFNYANKFYSIYATEYITSLYEMFAGDYNYFFDTYKDYSISFVSNGRTKERDLSTIDKIFSNINFRADVYEDTNLDKLSITKPFDTIRVWNEYLDTESISLQTIKDGKSNLKNKFRIWHIDVPRSKTYTQNNRTYKRDRIRNTWCKVQFTKINSWKVGTLDYYNNRLSVIHDMDVLYYIH